MASTVAGITTIVRAASDAEANPRTIKAAPEVPPATGETASSKATTEAAAMETTITEAATSAARHGICGD